ncbi:hypothetical protein B296_00054141 [Ensete ventricosum]|uniref:Uncharacterized protein n=1 Tax=Ensete ventricosum TaxID=4639 RepID=A0A426XE77_ENSVE|nr:hypothetical protein B296_00054141 [Ensete ventricosum]
MWEKEYAFYRVKVDGGANGCLAGLGSRLCSKRMETNGWHIWSPPPPPGDLLCQKVMCSIDSTGDCSKRGREKSRS